MAYLKSHGGGCCGRRCISSLAYGQTDEKSVVESLHRVLLAAHLPRVQNITELRKAKSGQILEVTLTNRQIMDRPYLLTALKKVGFVNVFAGRNSNSGNIVQVFLYHPNPSKTKY